MGKILNNFAIIYLLTASLTFSANDYQSSLIEYLHDSYIQKGYAINGEINSIDTLANGTRLYHMSCDKIKSGIVVEITSDSIICDIGIELFAPNEYEPSQKSLVYKFISRYLFAKLIDIDISNYFKNSYLKINAAYNGVEIDNWKSLKIDKFLSSYSWTKIDLHGKMLDVFLADSLGNKINFLIPRNVNLLSGMDKKELDDQFVKLIRKHSSQYPKKISHDYDSLSFSKFNDSIFVVYGKKIFEGLDQSNYYKLEKDSPKLIFTSEDTYHSLKNLTLNPDLCELNLEINHHIYSNKIVKSKQNYKNLYSVLSKNCEVYSGLESNNNDTLKFLILFYQPLSLNNHLLTLTIEDKYFNDNSANLAKAELYTNIRIDNMNDLFKNYQKKQTLMKMEIKD